MEQVREQRAQQQQQQQMVAMGMAAAQGAKTLSEAQTADPSVLTALSTQQVLLQVASNDRF
ncbi:hypothetical protein P5P93_24625 [Klebsiella pneumoniae]|nr:hypothetical protein P5P93_24625 [Klebsiella pneumoniae]